jgi:RNA polymerase sigma-70 factor (ECF subfamily)
VWEEFIREFSPVIVWTVRNKARSYGETSPEVHEELAQDVFLKLCADNCAKLRAMDASGHSNPHAYFKVVALNHVKDYFKGQRAGKRGSGVSPESLDDVQPESPARATGGMADMQWQIEMRQVEGILRELGFSEREIAVFDLYYFQDWTAKEIAALAWVGLSEKGVESLLRRMRLALRSFFEEDKGSAA